MRYFKRDYEDCYYIFDSANVSEDEFDEKMGYDVFEDSLTGDEIVDLLNENEQLKESYKEFEDECQSTSKVMSRKQNDLYRENFKLKEENEQLKFKNYELKFENTELKMRKLIWR